MLDVSSWLPLARCGIWDFLTAGALGPWGSLGPPRGLTISNFNNLGLQRKHHLRVLYAIYPASTVAPLRWGYKVYASNTKSIYTLLYFGRISTSVCRCDVYMARPVSIKLHVAPSSAPCEACTLPCCWWKLTKKCGYNVFYNMYMYVYIYIYHGYN